MKRLLLSLAAGLGVLAAGGPDLDNIKTVYLLPMASGLDQFLAIRLTSGAILQVVTDAQRADAVLTDRIGTGFEQKLDELYGAKPKEQDQKDQTRDFTKPTMNPLSRSKGAIFLVDRKTRDVVWSTYMHPKNASPGEMNHVADRIADRLEEDRKGK